MSTSLTQMTISGEAIHESDPTDGQIGSNPQQRTRETNQELRLRYINQPAPLDYRTNQDVEHLPSSLAIGDHVFERVDTGETRRLAGVDEVKARYHRRVVTDIVRADGQWEWHFKERLPAGEDYVRILESKDPSVRSYPPPEMPSTPHAPQSIGADKSQDWACERWECPPESPPVLDISPKKLRFEKASGTGSRNLVNRLLGGGSDGQFDHLLPGVQKWKHAFVASYDGRPYSVAVLEHSRNTHLGEGTGEKLLYLSRLCNHPHAPKNTSSWMLGRIRGWLRHNTEVETLVALAGIDGNDGTVYKAANFEYDGEVIDEHDVYGEWRKKRWVYQIRPSKDLSDSSEPFVDDDGRSV